MFKLTKISCGQLTSEHWDEGHFAQLKRGGCDEAPERREVVFVAMAYFLDDAVFAQTSNDCGDLPCVLVGQMFAQVGVLESTDHELAAQDNGEQLEIVAVEQVEAAVGAVVGANLQVLVPSRCTTSR